MKIIIKQSRKIDKKPCSSWNIFTLYGINLYIPFNEKKYITHVKKTVANTNNKKKINAVLIFVVGLASIRQFTYISATSCSQSVGFLSQFPYVFKRMNFC
ncbi:MAG: hypothetical protein FWC19_08110 [Treponema sp.]|nr:hypothetical protein [Treponema sp.]